jgi:hypothetical protein
LIVRTEPTPNTAGFAIKEAFEALGGVQRTSAILRWVNDRYPNRWEERTLGSHLRGCSVNNPIGIKYHPHFPRFLYKEGNGEFALYDPSRHGVFDERGYAEGDRPEEVSALDELREISEELQSKSEFANEAQLRDYLARNLGLLEPGLALWTGSEAESVEYAMEGRRIDILGKDRDGTPVVVELKLSKGHERTLGQALYYRGKLKQVLKVCRVRIIMVAAEITDELRIASTEVTDVDVFTYKLTMQVQKVDLSAS